MRLGQSRSFDDSDHLIIAKNGTVTDKSTGLMWQQEEAGEMTWKEALKYCENLKLAGYDDWRLPTIKELASLPQLNKVNPALDKKYFPNVHTGSSDLYWTSTTADRSSGSAWVVDFGYGGDGSSDKSSSYYARAVRLGQSGSFDDSDHLIISQQKPEPKPEAGPVIAKKDNTPPEITITEPEVTRGIYAGENILVKGIAEDESGISWVSINGKYANMVSEKEFELVVPLRFGDNKITVEASDKKKNKGEKKFTIKREAEVIVKDATPPKITITQPEVARGKVLSLNSEKIIVKGKAEDESGVSSVIVNDERAKMISETDFEIAVLLKVGDNQITVEATDTKGNSAKQDFKVKRNPDGSIISGLTGTYYALIIGINDYKHMRKLKNAKQDAIDVEKILKNQYGFKTKLMLDSTRDEIMYAINEYRSTILTEKDYFLVYYAGHGEFEKGADKAYWLPADAEPDNDTKWIIVDMITANIKRISSKHILIVADSCYSGTLARAQTTELQSKEERNRFLSKMDGKTSRTLIASGGNETVSDAGGQGHSIFAEVFISGLTEMEETVFLAEELFYQHIKERVAGKASQTPEYSIIKNSGHDGGDFVFRKK